MNGSACVCVSLSLVLFVGYATTVTDALKVWKWQLESDMKICTWVIGIWTQCRAKRHCYNGQIIRAVKKLITSRGTDWTNDCKGSASTEQRIPREVHAMHGCSYRESTHGPWWWSNLKLRMVDIRLSRETMHDMPQTATLERVFCHEAFQSWRVTLTDSCCRRTWTTCRRDSKMIRHLPRLLLLACLLVGCANAAGGLLATAALLLALCEYAEHCWAGWLNLVFILTLWNILSGFMLTLNY